MSLKIGVLEENTGAGVSFIKMRLPHRQFPVSFAQIFKNRDFYNTSRRLLLKLLSFTSSMIETQASYVTGLYPNTFPRYTLICDVMTHVMVFMDC